MSPGYCVHGVECFHCQVEREIVEMAKQMPSTEAGIEAVDLAGRAVSNVTNFDFKVRAREYLKGVLAKAKAGA